MSVCPTTAQGPKEGGEHPTGRHAASEQTLQRTRRVGQRIKRVHERVDRVHQSSLEQARVPRVRARRPGARPAARSQARAREVSATNAQISRHMERLAALRRRRRRLSRARRLAPAATAGWATAAAATAGGGVRPWASRRASQSLSESDLRAPVQPNCHRDRPPDQHLLTSHPGQTSARRDAESLPDRWHSLLLRLHLAMKDFFLGGRGMEERGFKL